LNYRALSQALLAVGSLHGTCGSEQRAPHTPARAVADPLPAPTVQPTPLAEVESAKAPPSFADWLRAHVPAAARIGLDATGAPIVVHTVVAGDTSLTIAKAYLDVTTVYRAKDLATEIAQRHANLSAGVEVEIPDLLPAPYKTPEEERLRWPKDRVLKGVFISGIFAGSFWPETLDRLATHGLNAVVLDGKDYMGTVNYPTRVPLAVETGAAKDAPIPDLFRAIRFAHARGIRAVIRIPCFHDPWAAKQAPRTSLMSTSGRPFEMGWTDPANDEVQGYIVDLVKEAVDLGADEVQLDYVRFPVYSPGIKYAAMPPADGHRSEAIKAFVRRVHEATQAHEVPLSLDIFGVTATGSPSDIEALGQNIGVIGSEAEVLSPMVYPSHYAEGFFGFSQPGDHPEIVGMGTKAAIEKLAQAGISATIMRPWLQASAYKTPTYGPKYIQDEIKSAEANGATGWLFWDPDNSYWAVWRAMPVVKPAEDVVKPQ
jgi:hypothetical protein